MRVKIERASEKDIETLLEFSRRLNEFERKIYPNYQEFEKMKDRVERFFRKRVNREDNIFLLAKVDDKPVGMIYGWIVRPFPFFKEEKYGYIAEVWVEEEFRGKGIGKKLLKEIIKWFKEKGIRWIRTDVLQKNKNAIKFYEKFGFKEFCKYMELWLK